MRAKFNQSFKVQAVKKALNRRNDVSLKEISISLGVGYSTLTKWIVQSKNQEFEMASSNEINDISKEKRPLDWSLEERLNVVIECAGLDDAAISERCRQHGIFPHHVAQWKRDFVSNSHHKTEANKGGETKSLKNEVKSLQRQLNRKDKALAETAALLVLQKKVNDIWGTDEEDS